jgi:hypothetical protein
VVLSLAQLLWDLSGAVALGTLWIVGGGMFQNFHFVFVSAPPGGPKIVFANARAPEQVENVGVESAFWGPLDVAVAPALAAMVGFGANSCAVLAVEKEFEAPEIPAEPG